MDFHLQRKTVTTVFIIFLIIFFSPLLRANTGSITGKVIDSESGSPLRSATIMVKDTKLGAFSDVKGEYKVRNLKPGVYSLKVSYVGYLPKEIENIEVPSSQEVNITVVLQPESRMTEEVIVDAVRSNDNQAAILAIRKNASNVSDGIGIEEIKKLPDSDAGQSLKRVTGVTLVDNKFIYIRGVSERYSNTTLNGAAVTTTEPDKKAFSYDIFPSDLLENISVVKSFTPDLPGNFAGGLVQLNTTNFPDKFSLKFSTSTSFNTNVTGKSDAFIYSPGGSTDWLGFDDGTRALPADFPANRREIDHLRTSSYNPYDTTGAKEKYEALARKFNAKLWRQDRKTIHPLDNRSFSLSFSNAYDLAEDSRFGIVSSLNYGNSYSLNFLERNRLTASGSEFYLANGTVATRSVNIGGLLNLALKLGPDHQIGFKNVYSRSADDEATQLEGQDVAYQFLDYKNFSSHYTQKELYSTQINGDHNVFSNNTLIEWRFGYSKSNRDEPDYRRIRFARQLADAQENPFTPYSPEIVYTEYGDGARVGRFYSDLNDNIFSGALNLTIPLGQMKIKVGALTENNERDFNARSITIITPPQGLADDIDSILYDYKNPDRIFAPENFRVEDGFRISEDSKLMDSYSASESLWAFYFMLDFPFKAFNQDLRFIGGVRFENSHQTLNSYMINDEKVEVNNINKDFLPSLNLIWKANELTNLRLSYSKTLTRPTFREYAPFAFFDFLTQFLVRGNPSLVRSLIENFDLRYELFPQAGEVFSVGVFYKTFENAIEETIFPQQSEISRTYDNAKGIARNYGLEFELRKNLGTILSFLSDFTINLNLALIKSEITVLQGGKGTEDTRSMWGQSPYTFNLGLFYYNPDWKTSLNIGYNIYGKRIIQVAQQGIYTFKDPHIYELPRNMLDFSVIQPLFSNMELKLSIKNLLNEKTIYQQGGKTVDFNDYGTDISFGISYKIQ